LLRLNGKLYQRWSSKRDAEDPEHLERASAAGHAEETSRSSSSSPRTPDEAKPSSTATATQMNKNSSRPRHLETRTRRERLGTRPRLFPEDSRREGAVLAQSGNGFGSKQQWDLLMELESCGSRSVSKSSSVAATKSKCSTVESCANSGAVHKGSAATCVDEQPVAADYSNPVVDEEVHHLARTLPRRRPRRSRSPLKWREPAMEAVGRLRANAAPVEGVVKVNPQAQHQVQIQKQETQQGQGQGEDNINTSCTLLTREVTNDEDFDGGRGVQDEPVRAVSSILTASSSSKSSIGSLQSRVASCSAVEKLLLSAGRTWSSKRCRTPPKNGCSSPSALEDVHPALPSVVDDAPRGRAVEFFGSLPLEDLRGGNGKSNSKSSRSNGRQNEEIAAFSARSSSSSSSACTTAQGLHDNAARAASAKRSLSSCDDDETAQLEDLPLSDTQHRRNANVKVGLLREQQQQQQPTEAKENAAAADSFRQQQPMASAILGDDSFRQHVKGPLLEMVSLPAQRSETRTTSPGAAATSSASATSGKRKAAESSSATVVRVHIGSRGDIRVVEETSGAHYTSQTGGEQSGTSTTSPEIRSYRRTRGAGRRGGSRNGSENAVVALGHALELKGMQMSQIASSFALLQHLNRM